VRVVWPPRNRTLGFVDVLGLLGIAGLLVARYVPVARLPFWGCALRKATGWPCPGCGLTRVAERVAQGNLSGAWEANPLGTVAAVALGALGLWTVLHLAFKVPVPQVQLSSREAWRLRAALVLALAINYGAMLVRAWTQSTSS